MKRLIFTCIAVLVCLFPLASQAEGGFVIDSFDSRAEIQSDGTLRVTESITANFSNNLHGIYRDIPIVYRNADGSKRYTTIEVSSVTNESGQSIPYEQTYSKIYLRLKIGDPDRLVSGVQNYVIRYVASGVLAAFPDHDELYWNATGHAWEVPINSATATVTLPSGEIIKTFCYVGILGSREACGNSATGATARYASNRALPVGEGMSVVAEFPKGSVPIVTVEEPLTMFNPKVMIYIIFGFLLIAIPAIIILLRMWWLKGRDEYYKRNSLNDPNSAEVIRPLFGSYEPIVPEYDAPGGLRPAEIGVLLDERADPGDISATIVDLAVRGYMKIEEIPKKGIFSRVSYRLIKSDKASEGLLAYESLLLDKLFAQGDTLAISEVKEDFHEEMEEVKKALYAEVTNKKLFVGNPEEVRSSYKLAAFVIGVAVTLYFFVFYSIFDGVGGVYSLPYWFCFGMGCGAAALVIALGFISSIMPKRSAYGRDMYRQALGYKLFVSGTEKYRQPFFEKNNIFMEVLPYAMVFGVTAQLAQAMEQMHLKPDLAGWYIGYSAFNITTFGNDMNHLSAALSTNLATSPSSSGSGGFSGGGFGGGGGGGW